MADLSVAKKDQLETIIQTMQDGLAQGTVTLSATQDLKDDAETAKTAAETAEGLAESHKDVAASYANFAGQWSGLTGALNIPASVRHNGNFWMLLSDVADVTATEPAAGNSDWAVLGGASITVVDNLTSQVTAAAALSPNMGRVLDEKKSDITTPIENVPTGSNYSTVATDADKIKNRTDTGDFIVTKDEIASGRAIAFMKTTASTVNVTFATDVDAIPSSLTSGFAIPEQDQIIWLFQVRPNEWKVLGSSSHDQNTDTKLDEGGANEVTAIELRNHVDSTSDAHTQNTDTKLDEGGANETSASELRSHLDSTDDPHGTKDLGLGTNGSATNLDSATTEDVIRSTASFTGTILTSLSKPISLVQDGASNTITVSAGAGVTLVGSTLSTTNDKDSLGILPIGNDTFLIFYRETPAND